MANFHPLTAEIGSLVWATPANFNGFAHLAFVTAATSLTGGQPNFARCLAVSWAGYYTHIFGGSCPLTEFCPVHNSFYVQVLHSSISAALLHGTPVAGVSQTLRRGTRNGITKLSQRAPPIFGWEAITLGIGPHSRFYLFYCDVSSLSALLIKINEKLLPCGTDGRLLLSGFQTVVTLTFTLYRVIRYTVVHQSSTYIYTTKCH